MKDILERLAAGEVRDPQTGAEVSVPVRLIEVASSLAGRERALVSALGLGPALVVVSDPDTEDALGARVKRALAGRGCLIPILLRAHPRPDQATVEAIMQEAETADALLAVGSGTINDLCKYASFRLGRPYAVFATAPSMNGYTSRNASIMIDGLKQTLPAQLPEGAFFDLEVLRAAPVRLIRAGLGDTICRPTVQADWLLAHLLRGDPYRELPFDLLIEEEERILAEPQALPAGDLPAMACLTRALIVSGLGMTYCGGSWSASQGEHLISHYMELTAASGQPEPLHGEQIGVAAITMARLQETLLERERIEVFPSELNEREFLERYGPRLGPHCWEEYLPKRLDPQRAADLNRKLVAGWSDIRGRVAAVSRPASLIREALRRAGAPTSPEELGWTPQAYRQAVLHAAELRNRYTFLDLARDCRLLERFVDATAHVQ
jgi:glycerol-1-phosphate dehydrogenase [NAD(P)+]